MFILLFFLFRSLVDCSNQSSTAGNAVNVIQYALHSKRPFFENFSQLRGTLKPIWFPGHYFITWDYLFIFPFYL